MDSKETHQQQQQRNRNAAALSGPTFTSQAMHNRSSVGALPLRQPQPQQALMLNASPYSVATQQPWMQQLGIEQRGRGRPRMYAPPPPDVIDGRGGADAKQRRNNTLGGEGEDESITALVITVNPGEDIARKLVAFMNQEPREVCILSAEGDVSIAELQSRTPLGFVKYAGLYYITNMSGTFINTESDDGATVTRIGNLSVSLAGPDAKFVGGYVGGMLVAGSQVKVVVGIFGPEGVKLSAASSSAPGNVLNSNGGGGPGLPQPPLFHQVGNSTLQPPHHRHLWPGNNPQ